MSTATSFPFPPAWSRIWSDLEKMLKFGRKVHKVVDDKIAADTVEKLDRHINRLESLFDKLDAETDKHPLAAYGLGMLSNVCEEAMNELVDSIDPDLPTGVWIKIEIVRE